MTKTALPPITSFEDLQSYAQGQIVTLPPFAEGQPFVARLRRPSMMALVKSGKIPNTLLQTANSLFLKSSVDDKDDGALDSLWGVLDTLCEAALLEPTYAQVKEAGLSLTDDQMMFIFKYTQQGVKALESFRKQS